MLLRKRNPAVLLAIGLCGPACGQLVLQPSASIVPPHGNWADTVVIAFDTTEPVGTLRRVDGMGDEYALHAVFARHPSLVLRGLLATAPTDYQRTQLLLKLNRLKVDEFENATLCLLHAEVIERENGSFARLYEGSVAVSGERCGKKAECHEENIVRALEGFFRDFELSRGRPREPIDAVACSTLFLPDAANSPILHAERLQRGLYRTFMQFRANAPDTL